MQLNFSIMKKILLFYFLVLITITTNAQEANTALQIKIPITKPVWKSTNPNRIN